MCLQDKEALRGSQTVGGSSVPYSGVPLNMHDDLHEMLMMNNQLHHGSSKWVNVSSSFSIGR